MVAALLVAAGQARADGNATISKQHSYVQTGFTAIADDPVNGPWNFQAQFSGGKTEIDSKFFTAPNSLAQSLAYTAADQDWAYVSPGYASAGALNAIFPSGSYTLALQGKTAPLGFAGDTYPNAPVVSASAGTWAGGVLIVDPTQALALTLNFTSNYNAALARMTLAVSGTTADLSTHNGIGTSSPAANQLTLTIPANTLVNGTYQVRAALSNFATVDQTSIAGLLLASYYSTQNTFTLQVISGGPVVLQDQTVSIGGSVNFTAPTSGVQPVTYQWYKEGFPIAGATTANYGIVAAKPLDAGTYTVVLTGSNGSVTSNPAKLTVGAPYDGFYGANASDLYLEPDPNLSRGTYGLPEDLRLSFLVHDNIVTDVQFSGDPLLPNGGARGAGKYCTVGPDGFINFIAEYLDFNSNNTVFYTVTLQATRLLDAKGNFTENFGLRGSFTEDYDIKTPVPDVGFGPKPISGTGTISDDFITVDGSLGVAGFPTDTGNWSPSTDALLEPFGVSEFPIFTAQPAGTTTGPSGRVSFSVSVRGLGLSYQWFKNGQAIPGATNATYTIPNVTALDAGNYTVAVSNAIGTVTSSAAALTVGPAITTQPTGSVVAAGGNLTLSVAAAGTGTSYQWLQNSVAISGATGSTLNLPNLQPVNTGLYAALVTSGGTTTSDAAIVGVSTTAKVVGTGSEVGTNIVHPNGNVFDQVLLSGAAATITADSALNQVTRLSFIDLNDDIVQVEFSGPGTLSLVLDNPSGPAAPVKYTQPAVAYMKGHAEIVITGANDNTNVSVFTVGRATAFDPTGAFNILLPISATNNPANNGSSLFQGQDATVYDGVADIAFIAISSANGKFGGVRTAGASYFATKGLTGVYAPGVQFSGPLFVGDINASGTATPVIEVGSVADARITGGDLLQANRQPVKVSGLTQLKFTAGATSGGVNLPPQTNKAQLLQNGTDVTAQIVVNPAQ